MKFTPLCDIKHSRHQQKLCTTPLTVLNRERCVSGVFFTIIKHCPTGQRHQLSCGVPVPHQKDEIYVNVLHNEL